MFQTLTEKSVVNRPLKAFMALLQLAVPYFRSEDRRSAFGLLGTVVVIEIVLVLLMVLMNEWSNRFYTAISDRDWDAFIRQTALFCVLTAGIVILHTYRLYFAQGLEIRWRRWMTDQYLFRWLNGSNHYTMQLIGDATDNPDQRIAEDVRLFIERTLGIGSKFINSVATLGSFISILWLLSARAPLHLFGHVVTVPGYLVWAALAYSLLGTVIAQLIGHPLVALNFDQQRKEANFRFDLVSIREHSEQIALLRGEVAEVRRLRERFAQIAANWYAIMSRQKLLSFFTESFTQASAVWPVLIVSPAYFSGAMSFGGLMQTGAAFAAVQGALALFVVSYRELAEWRAVAARLEGFDRGSQQAMSQREQSQIKSTASSSPTDLMLEDLALEAPGGRALLKTKDFSIGPGDRVLVSGKSGTGKSTLFRAVAGIWHLGRGRVGVPIARKLMVLPQRPYVPSTSLHEALSYPREKNSVTPAAAIDMLNAVGLSGLVARLSEQAPWGQTLSPGEQQRISIARAILATPDFLLLDEATAGLDQNSAQQIYRLLDERLPETALVVISHQPVSNSFQKRVSVVDRAGGHTVLYSESSTERSV